jgi:predicted patatin/cPLA2 family phospholipase
MSDQIELDSATYGFLVGCTVLLRDLLQEYHKKGEINQRMLQMLKHSEKQYRMTCSFLERLMSDERRLMQIPQDQRDKIERLSREVIHLRKLLEEYRKGNDQWWKDQTMPPNNED